MPGKQNIPAHQSIIDEETFTQLIELDEDDGGGFLESVVTEWFEQAVKTFAEMDAELEKSEPLLTDGEPDPDEEKQPLIPFSRRAHYLKGSSGQIGIQKVRDSCSKLQHLGELWDEEKSREKVVNLSEKEAFKRIKPILAKAKREYDEAETWLRKYIGDESEDSEGPIETPKTQIQDQKKTPIDIVVGKGKGASSKPANGRP